MQYHLYAELTSSSSSHGPYDLPICIYDVSKLSAGKTCILTTISTLITRKLKTFQQVCVLLQYYIFYRRYVDALRTYERVTTLGELVFVLVNSDEVQVCA